MDGTTYNTSTVCAGNYMQCKYPTWIKQHPVSQFVCARFGARKTEGILKHWACAWSFSVVLGAGGGGVWISVGLVFRVHSRCTRVEGSVV
jgi:hypothetical protein